MEDLPISFFFARFNPVVGGGANGSVIHYSRNDQKVRSYLSYSLSHWTDNQMLEPLYKSFVG